jgi:hypothetical protein
MSFSESSGMIRIARIHQNLMSSLWRSMKEHNFFFKLLLFIPVLYYSIICIFFISFFYLASVIDIIPYLIAKIANGIRSTADDLSYRNFGFFGTIFYPPVVFLMGILMLFVVILPKAFGMVDES